MSTCRYCGRDAEHCPGGDEHGVCHAIERDLTPAPDPRDTELSTLRALLAAKDAEIARLEKLVYVPGMRKCPKCAFVLISSTLNTGDGSITARDAVGEPCPNCGTPLWRVSERDAGNEMIDRADAAADDNKKLREALKGLVDWLDEQRKADLIAGSGDWAYEVANQLVPARAALEPPR